MGYLKDIIKDIWDKVFANTQLFSERWFPAATGDGHSICPQTAVQQQTVNYATHKISEGVQQPGGEQQKHDEVEWANVGEGNNPKWKMK